MLSQMGDAIIIIFGGVSQSVILESKKGIYKLFGGHTTTAVELLP
jgi:hypothetical protein